MNRSSVERELERLHGESWGWALACAGRDRDLAEEVLQTAYVRILSGAAKPSGRSSFRTWVFGVIRLIALEELRKARRMSRRIDDAPAGFEPADTAAAPDDVAERSERAAVLEAALRRLSERQREILHLVFYHGMTIEEAAGIMKIGIGSARTHYDRGKKALGELLARLDV